jgi:hypothetical protein
MTQNIYTLITYVEGESGWVDRCGDWVSGEDSIFEKTYFNDKKLAGEALGRTQFLNSSGEITFLINGIELYPNDYECEDFISEEQLSELKSEYEEIDMIAFNFREALSLEKKKADEIAKIQKQAEEALRQKKERDYYESRERAELAKLIAKYGKGV